MKEIKVSKKAEKMMTQLNGDYISYCSHLITVQALNKSRDNLIKYIATLEEERTKNIFIVTTITEGVADEPELFRTLEKAYDFIIETSGEQGEEYVKVCKGEIDIDTYHSRYEYALD